MAEQPEKSLTWQAAVDWAKSIGGELPGRREQRVLFANAKAAFDSTWYWSGEQDAAYTDCAWVQYFVNGYQYDYHKSYEGRARAVRRISILE
jgi:hypothetical protein